MSIHVALNHVTQYNYDKPVQLGPQIIRLRPAPHSRTRILSYSQQITPEPHFINWQQDAQSNWLARVVFPEKAREFKVEIDLVAEMSVLNPFDYFLADYAKTVPFEYQKQEKADLAPYLAVEPAGPLMKKYLATLPAKDMATNDFIVTVNQRVANSVDYIVRMEPGVQAPEYTLEIGSGSCRDSAWLLVQIMRHCGIAARFASGYLIQLTADVKSLDGPSGPEEDFTDLHAWCEVYLPGAGWIGLDVTSGLLAGEGHIPVACTPEPSEAAPISGGVEKSNVEFHHSMSVQRVFEAPRVTKPYTDDQWEAIEALGHEVDKELKDGDVRLTMGGEPTFVAIDDPAGAEWNGEAMGPTKRGYSIQLFKRLVEKYAKKGLIHFGQGKWYPGEQLPRWSLNAFWRRDGEPVWNDPSLVGDEANPTEITEDMPRRFLTALTEKLGMSGKHIFDAYEDAIYMMWRERRLPSNVDPFNSKVTDPLERARLCRVFEQGLDHLVGAVLPIGSDDEGGFRTSSWFLRTERCSLLPGDSAMGFRLPLESQPWVAEADFPFVIPVDPSQEFPKLATHAAMRAQSLKDEQAAATTSDSAKSGKIVAASRSVEEDRAPALNESATEVVRTALCAEIRNGVLYLFMPPLEKLDDYLKLVTAIEAVATDLEQPVLLEGYEPPRDPRLNLFRVTPDPGVIEVNLHPSVDWPEIVDKTHHLYDNARELKLTAEKFMVDGRHTGTGGGNHFVMGGATTLDSPFLRRPDLLRSLISYWVNHPSLSFLFSGLFIGPTSQSPRIDEARNDALYELDLAFAQFPKAGEECPPWHVDRLLRNLLVDATGNTHRTEFCVDKLYSPDSATGRLGLLELRAFEMPPHAQMSLVQQLLLRALVARFWRKPYAPERLMRWGNELHDRWMMPYFIEQDFAEVIADLNADGYPFDLAWFAPHFSFRFPIIGDFSVQGAHFEFRHALEPWHVLGEEGSPGGTVRYVDSSLERIELRVTGLVADRYAVTCNGETMPLRPTGRVGEYVAGVRFRAWQPSESLHPLLPSDTPLTFDLVDRWNERSLGGGQYHVTHPGGRSYDDFPINAFEAESRRLNRFFRSGHSPGTTIASEAKPSLEFPFTLDLRMSHVR